MFLFGIAGLRTTSERQVPQRPDPLTVASAIFETPDVSQKATPRPTQPPRAASTPWKVVPSAPASRVAGWASELTQQRVRVGRREARATDWRAPQSRRPRVQQPAAVAVAGS